MWHLTHFHYCTNNRPTKQKSIEADEDSKELIRLRTYLPILKHYCDTGDVGNALSVFKRMQSTAGVILEPETYVLLLASIAENKWFW